MHIGPVKESSGDLNEPKPTERKCPICNGAMTYQIWESHCGGYEDIKYKCTECRHVVWVDGIDS